MRPEVASFLKRWKLSIQNTELLEEALTHASYRAIDPHVRYNERLEFLGDAVLDLVVGEWLFHRFPEFGPRELTHYRALLVDRDQLAAFAQQLGLEPLLRRSPSAAQHDTAGRQRMLADAFEALMAALYLDQGLQAVRDFVYPLLEKAFPRVRRQFPPNNYKGWLQEWSQSQGLGVPRYTVIAQRGSAHRPWFRVQVALGDEVLGEGEGPSKKRAQQAAARQALLRLGLLSEDEEASS